MPLVLCESHDDIHTITLNAPERLNALDLDLLDELASAIASVADDAAARVLVVTGEGRGFCAGANLANMFGDTNRPTDEMREHLLKVYGSFLGLRDLAIPTIAAVHGPAVGAGLNIALACDVIVAGPKAKFGPTFAQIGLHPGGGCSAMLTERIGRGRANAALFSGDLIDSDEAWRLGLSDVRAEDAKAEAQRLAALYASRDPKLNKDMKRSVQLAVSADFSTSLAFEAQSQAESVRSDQFAKFMADFLAKD